MSKGLEVKDYESLSKSVRKLEETVDGLHDQLTLIAVELKGTTAEAIIKTHGSRDIVEYHTMIRVQYDRLLKEVNVLKVYLGCLNGGLLAAVMDDDNG